MPYKWTIIEIGHGEAIKDKFLLFHAKIFFNYCLAAFLQHIYANMFFESQSVVNDDTQEASHQMSYAWTDLIYALYQRSLLLV